MAVRNTTIDAENTRSSARGTNFIVRPTVSTVRSKSILVTLIVSHRENSCALISFVIQIEAVNCTLLVLARYVHPTYSHIFPLLLLACVRLDKTVCSIHQKRRIILPSLSKAGTASIPEEKALTEPEWAATSEVQLAPTTLLITLQQLWSMRYSHK
jgi:hypothetical protein